MSVSSSEKSSNPIKAAATVIGGSVALILGIVLIANYAVSVYSGRSLKGSSAMSDEAVAKRLKPVGDLVVVDANAPKVLKAAEQVYAAVCIGCHAAGVAGAPKFGDKAAWASRISSGYEQLVKNAIKGIRGMPPRGGSSDLADVEVARAAAYMANAAGAKFKMPEAPKTVEIPQPASSAATPVSTPPQASIRAESGKGKSVYESTCVACHGAGIAGAPKFGDKAAWAPRIAQGADALHNHAVKGFQGKAGMMPPKGGNASLADADVAAAVDYMVSQAK